MVVARDWSEDGLIGAEFQFCKMKRILESDCTTVQKVLNSTELCTYKWLRWYIHVMYILPHLNKKDLELASCRMEWRKLRTDVTEEFLFNFHLLNEDRR